MVPPQETADNAKFGVEIIVQNGRVCLEISTPQGTICYSVPQDRLHQLASVDPEASDLSSEVWQALEAVGRRADAVMTIPVETRE